MGRFQLAGVNFRCNMMWCIGLCLLSLAVHAETINLAAFKDNTLFQGFILTDDASNGAGNYFFAGATNQPLLRRGVIQFDIAGQVPQGATIESVVLRLHVSRVATNTSRNVSLHLINNNWGEGNSNAPAQEGQGTTPGDGDATWRHTFYPSVFWSTPGGDFVIGASATTSVGGIGFKTWGSTAAMVTDVQQWLDQSETNFGWLLKGDETTGKTAKRFDSREISNANIPNLELTYTLPAATGSCCTGFSCQVVTEVECSGLDGSYRGDGTSCDLNPCDPLGACCALNGECTDTAQSLCLDSGGSFQALGVSCASIQSCPIFKDGFEDISISRL